MSNAIHASIHACDSEIGNSKPKKSESAGTIGASFIKKVLQKAKSNLNTQKSNAIHASIHPEDKDIG